MARKVTTYEHVTQLKKGRQYRKGKTTHLYFPDARPEPVQGKVRDGLLLLFGFLAAVLLETLTRM